MGKDNKTIVLIKTWSWQEHFLSFLMSGQDTLSLHTQLLLPPQSSLLSSLHCRWIYELIIRLCKRKCRRAWAWIKRKQGECVNDFLCLFYHHYHSPPPTKLHLVGITTSRVLCGHPNVFKDGLLWSEPWKLSCFVKKLPRKRSRKTLEEKSYNFSSCLIIIIITSIYLHFYTRTFVVHTFLLQSLPRSLTFPLAFPPLGIEMGWVSERRVVKEILRLLAGDLLYKKDTKNPKLLFTDFRNST